MPGITIEKLLEELKGVGAEYYKKNETMWPHNNQNAANALNNVYKKIGGGKFTEELVQRYLLQELSEIFWSMESSRHLLKKVREALVKYEPFQNIDRYIKIYSGSSKPEPAHMAMALEGMFNLFSNKKHLVNDLEQAKKIDLEMKLKA